MMEVRRAEYAGACYGVQRALDLVTQAAELPGTVQTLGPLIHNPIVVADLASKGVSAVADPHDVTAERVVIRSHGVTPQTRRNLELTGAEVIDATCPHVLRAQRAASRLASSLGSLVVVGEQGHPEVEGLRACAEEAHGHVWVVPSPDDLPETLPSNLGVVVQTTQRRETLDAILSALKDAGVTFELCDTVCDATQQRQAAAKELASQVDCMIVIGGRNSSNTTRLFEICRDAAPAALHIESANELRPSLLADVRSVGVTAGASTPEDHIRAVVDLLLSPAYQANPDA